MKIGVSAKKLVPLLLVLLICMTQYDELLANMVAVKATSTIDTVNDRAHQIVNQTPPKDSELQATTALSDLSENSTVEYFRALTSLAVNPSVTGNVPRVSNRTLMLEYANALALLQNGFYEEGATKLADMNAHPVLFRLGIESYLRNQHPDNAVMYLQHAYDLNPHPSYQVHLTVAQRNLVKSAESLSTTDAEHLLKSIIATTNTEIVLGEAFLSLVLLATAEPALKSYLIQIEKSPASQSTHMVPAYKKVLQKLSQLYITDQNNTELFIVAQKGSQLFPNMSEFYYWQGISKERQQELNAAISLYQQALSLKPDYTIYLDRYERVRQLINE